MALPQVTIGGGITAYRLTDANGNLVYVTADRGLHFIGQGVDIVIKHSDFADLATAMNAMYSGWAYTGVTP